MNNLTPVTRAMVQGFMAMMRASPNILGPEHFVTRHHFAPGIYMRELHIPKGMISIGKIHKYPCLNILAKGIRQTLVDGRMQTVIAPHIHLSPAGMQRISYTLEDAIWITVHNTNKTDIAEIERDMVCETEEEYQAFLTDSALLCLS